MVLPLTLVIAAACAVINVWLSVRVTQRRMGAKVMMGDGGDSLMLSRGRAHSNFAEYAPFALILMGLIELARGASPWLWGLGVLFVLARIAHPLGMDRTAPNPLRAGGFLVTNLVLAILAGWALAIAYGATATPAPANAIELAPASA
jgi:uncharacterized protein